jgi:rubrerythrin
MTSISTMNTNRDQMIARIDPCRLFLLICVAAVSASCATNPPPLPPNNPADPHVHSGSRTPRNLLMQDETTVAIERELSATQTHAESAEKMDHDMQNMPAMQHGEMQHGEMDGHAGMQHGAAAQPEKKALADEMKKTSDQMKKTSDAMKQKSDEMKPATPIYTCPMHPEVRSDKPGKCPICGMKLAPKKKEEAHEGH